jgi:two-component system, NtrC family, response regulator AtoC
MNAGTTILILDHDPSTRTLLADAAEKLGWATRQTDSGLQAVELLESGEVDILIADLDATGLDALEVVRRARRDSRGLQTVVIASSGTMTKASEAVRLGIPDYLIRPFGAPEVKRMLTRLAEKRPASQAPTGPSAESAGLLVNLVGQSTAMEKVRHSIWKAAEKRIPVLILGESGTGKELVARAIHACSRWKDEPFVPVDCASLSPTLIESELFGHVRGAFPGAALSRVGLLATAGRGTLFLDEIGELAVDLQARLLRAIQEREIRPLGSNERIVLDARIVASTNIDVKEAVRAGTFREDLYYRLNVLSIRIPPLRERKDDILALVHHFLERYGAADGVADFSPEFMSRLMQYDWPGNVRELENSIQRAVALSSGPRLDVKDLPSTLVYRTESRSSTRDTARLQELERRAITEALAATGGDRARAAKILGIGKTTIYRKLKEYGFEEETGRAPNPQQAFATLPELTGQNKPPRV